MVARESIAVRVATLILVVLVFGPIGCKKPKENPSGESSGNNAAPSTQPTPSNPPPSQSGPLPNGSVAPIDWLSRFAGGPATFWIWGDASEKPYFLRTSFAAKGINAAKLKAAADDHLILTLNGKQLAASDDWHDGVEVDVTNALLPERNELVVRVWNNHGPSGFLFKLVMVSETGEVKYIVSDDSWTAAEDQGDKGKAVSKVAKYGELPWGVEFNFAAAVRLNQPAVKPNTPTESTPKEKPPAEAKKTTPPPKTEDTKWITEAKREYLAALQDKERRMTTRAREVGALDRLRLEAAKAMAETVQEYVKDGGDIANLPRNMVDPALVLIPDFIAAHRRESVIRSPDYPELVRQGKVPLYYPADKRKALYAEFSKITGIKTEWSVVVPFSGLTASEMDLLGKGLPGLKEGGLGRLSKEQRLLLLKAGALEFVSKQLGY